ncbi:hypothetical protein HUN12_10965 [Acinetobacter lactucae]|nr:hypothetical protein [Acinetobacter lactucae]
MKKIKVIVDTLQNASGQILSLDLLSHLIFKPLNHLPINIYKTAIYYKFIYGFIALFQLLFGL